MDELNFYSSSNSPIAGGERPAVPVETATTRLHGGVIQLQGVPCYGANRRGSICIHGPDQTARTNLNHHAIGDSESSRGRSAIIAAPRDRSCPQLEGAELLQSKSWICRVYFDVISGVLIPCAGHCKLCSENVLWDSRRALRLEFVFEYTN
jgi:hypothetical protein